MGKISRDIQEGNKVMTQSLVGTQFETQTYTRGLLQMSAATLTTITTNKQRTVSHSFSLIVSCTHFVQMRKLSHSKVI